MHATWAGIWPGGKFGSGMHAARKEPKLTLLHSWERSICSSNARCLASPPPQSNWRGLLPPIASNSSLNIQYFSNNRGGAFADRRCVVNLTEADIESLHRSGFPIGATGDRLVSYEGFSKWLRAGTKR